MVCYVKTHIFILDKYENTDNNVNKSGTDYIFL